MTVSPDVLARHVDEFLAESPCAVVREDGETTYDMTSAKYSISSQHGKCVLHLWSPERNSVRRVLEAETVTGKLRLSVMQFGRSQPQKLEICRDPDARSSSDRKAARSGYQRDLHKILRRNFPGHLIENFTSAMDLNHSFGPVYTRGILGRGNSAHAVLGVNAQESQSSIDAALTFGLIWLDVCREREAPRRVLKGLKLFVPGGTADVVSARMGFLNHEIASFELYEVDGQEKANSQAELAEIDTQDRGNIATRLVRCADYKAVRERFAASIAMVEQLASVGGTENPPIQIAVISGSEIGLRFNGLQFARARLGLEPESFNRVEEIIFGGGASETILDESNGQRLAEWIRRLIISRRAGGDRHDPLWRMHPERWLESLVIPAIHHLDSRFDAQWVYSQVPAFAASDRAMIDILTVTKTGRLAVLELKADEDIHLPLQGLDYWARVRWHHMRDEFSRFGYFSGKQLSREAPLLFLVAPALRIHPTFDSILRYFSPEIDVTLLAVDERWREDLRVVFRKNRLQPVMASLEDGS